MKIMKILKRHVRILETMKILEFHVRITKLMKTIEFHLIILKIMKILEFHWRSVVLDWAIVSRLNGQLGVFRACREPRCYHD